MGYGNVTFTMATPFDGEISRWLLATVMGLARSQRDFAPMRRISALHFAGFAVLRVNRVPFFQRALGRPYLLFFSQFDGSASAYLADFSVLVPDYIDALWGKCIRYPGARRAEQFVHWLEQHALTDVNGETTQYDYHGYRVDPESAESRRTQTAKERPRRIADRLAPMPLIESAIELMFRLDALRAGVATGATDAQVLMDLAEESL
jgi:hypothetical protein